MCKCGILHAEIAGFYSQDTTTCGCGFGVVLARVRLFDPVETQNGWRKVMTREIPKAEWKNYFEQLGRDMTDRETSVQVLSPDVGAQILSDGLPFLGLIYNDEGAGSIELAVGTAADAHQTHNIHAPAKVAFQADMDGTTGTLDIEDADGRKTLVHFDRKIPVLATYMKSDLIAMR